MSVLPGSGAGHPSTHRDPPDAGPAGIYGASPLAEQGDGHGSGVALQGGMDLSGLCPGLAGMAQVCRWQDFIRDFHRPPHGHKEVPMHAGGVSVLEVDRIEQSKHAGHLA